MTALLLLGPATPMLFQGQESGASTRPFLFFADHDAEAGRQGRARAGVDVPGAVPAAHAGGDPRRGARPGAAETFAACKLDWSERERHARTVALHRDLLALRREDPAFAAGRRIGRRRGAGRPRRSRCASSRRGRRRPPADRQPGARPRASRRCPSRCSPRRPGGAGHGVVQRGSALRRRRNRAGRHRRGPAPARPRRRLLAGARRERGGATAPDRLAARRGAPRRSSRANGC